MCILFFYMILGYAGCRWGGLDNRAGKNLSWIVVHIATPALLIEAGLNREGRLSGNALLTAAVLSVVMFAILFSLAQIVPYLFRLEKEEIPTYKLMTILNNIGAMGFPLVASVYGSDALLYAAVFQIPFFLIVYSYGIRLLSNEETFTWRKLLNVGMVSCIVAMILYLSQVPVPDMIVTISSGLGSMTGPLSMMAIGVSLSAVPLRELFTDRKLLVFSGMKLLLIPIVGTWLIGHIISDQLLVSVSMVMLATPAASIVVMLSHEYDHNVELASKAVALTTLLSVITIPIVSAIVL